MTGPTVLDDPPIDDQAISDIVEDEIRLDQGVSLTQIDVSCTDGVVSLTGSVDNLLSKERAAKLAQLVRGVRSVVNRISVIPATVRSDSQITSDVKSALLSDPATDSYEVEVLTSDGHVELSGNVDSWWEKQLTSEVAKGVRGVQEVSNLLEVGFKHERPDTEIQADIERALRSSIYIDDALVDVKVNEGQVVLSGIVGSAHEKISAGSLAWMNGVASVDISRLEVDAWVRDERLRKDKFAHRSNQQVREAVKDAFLYDPRLKSFPIDVEVDNGSVTLRGAVDNLKAKRAAEQDARGTVGVVTVNNRLRVRSPKPPADSSIEESIRAAFTRDPFLERRNIVVSVENGTGHLYGSVAGYFEKARADDLASKVRGVLAVDNNLIVRNPDPYPYSPRLESTWYPQAFDWYDYQPRRTQMMDAEIKQEVEDELWWSPFVDSDDVEVFVRSGLVELTGTVDSWAEYHAATENAYEGGAAWVDNNLKVRTP